ncbi:MAG TPA: hypothetical protein VNH43_13720 [Vicinamibacteria bacterium]|nr:hypothetical protein [Vicinamibacteria bacterium]
MDPWRIRLFVVLFAATLLRCGGANPASPSGPGVTLEGMVLQGASVASAGSAGVSAQSARGGRITVTVQEDPSQSTTVSGNGSFKLDNVPVTGFTLVFSVDGVVLGSISISPVQATTTIKIKIVVQVTDHVELVDLEMNDDNEDPGNQDPKTCMINGGRAGEHIELEGVVASGGSDQFQLRVNGNRSSGLVDVTAAGASFKCQGDKSSSATCKASVKAGAQVHVKGTLTACTTSVASATATQVMVQKD